MKARQSLKRDIFGPQKTNKNQNKKAKQEEKKKSKL